PDHPQVADCLEVMGRVRQAESRHDLAIPLYARALAIRQQALGLEDSQTLLVQFWLADAYVLRNNDAEAEKVFRALIKAALRTRGADAPPALTGYTQLAAAMARQNRFAAAESFFKHVVRIEELSHGPDHELLIPHLNDLARFYIDQQRPAEAEAPYARVVE